MLVSSELGQEGPGNAQSSNLLVLPFYLTLCSALYHVFQHIWPFWIPKRSSYANYASIDGAEERNEVSNSDTRDTANGSSTVDQGNGDHVRKVLSRARLAGNVFLLGLSTITLWLDLRASDTTANHGRQLLSSPGFYSWLSFIYTAILAYFSLTEPNAHSAARHGNLILLCVLLVYLYRDVWPLATYDQTPLDLDAEGAYIVWAKIAALVCTAALAPACMPRPYLPVDPKNPMREPNPKHTASWLSRATYAFLDPLIWKAYRQKTHLRHDQLHPLADCWEAKYHARRAAKFLDPLRPGRRPMAWGLLRYFWREYFWMAVSVCCSSVASFAAPIAIKNVLRYLEIGPAASPIRPWFWLALLLFGPMVKAVCGAWFFSVNTTVRVIVEALVTQLVYEHTLRMRLQGVAQEERRGESAKKDFIANQTGRIHTLVTADLSNILGVVDILNFVIQIPMMVTFSIAFLYQILGWSALVGAASIVVFVPIPGWIGKKIKDAQTQRMKETDGRVQATSEAVGVMRMIKLFGWERNMIGKIEKKRDQELSWIWKIMVLKIINNVVGMLITSSTIFITYAVYTTVMKEELNASKIFSTMAVFDILRTQIQRVSWRMTLVIQAKVSFDRLDDFLTNTPLLDSFSRTGPRGDHQYNHTDQATDGGQERIGFKDAAFSWIHNTDVHTPPYTRRSDFVLRIDGELVFVKHGINVISGPTGSGKTSMLLALLSEMRYVPLAADSWFNLPRGSGVAYVAQESWVQNATVKENILFGAPYDPERYRKVIHQCALEHDLASFDGGDNAEVGERGITLSGGQKMRVTLARAIYSNAQTVLLDDIFASLDAHTSSWIVKNCLRGDLLQKRTVVLVTHNVPILAGIVDLIVTIGPDGTVGSHSQVERDLTICDRAPSSDAPSSGKDKSTLDDASSSSGTRSQVNDQGKLVTAEEIVEGRISLKSLQFFLGALGGRHPILLLASWLFAVTSSRLILILRVWFLGFWGSQYETHAPSEVPIQRFLQGFLVILTFGVLTTTVTQICYNIRVIKAVRSVHIQLITSVFTATLRWLDETPGGRIIARCTQDLRSIDEPIPTSTYEALDAVITVLTTIGAIILFVPLFTIPAVIVSFAGILIGSVYLRSQLAVKREMSNARSPVLAHVNATIYGLVSIRAYNAAPIFLQESLSKIDFYSRPAHACWNLNRWIGVRIDFLGTLFTATLATYLVYGGSVGAANSGFTLNMALGFCTYLFYLIRILNDLEVECNSLERIQGFLDIEHEEKASKDDRLPAAWPTSGDLRVMNLSARYSNGGPPILRDISFHITSGERIGIVGRTGSGKSSLALALLRCIITDGDILLDGVETKLVNLNVLRSNITIIPQAPELLSGTLRQNLDPFGEHNDATLLDALQSSGYFSLQRQKHGSRESHETLETLVTGAGANFSVGERQIIALARAMIRRSKVLILDEGKRFDPALAEPNFLIVNATTLATSAIDHQTDSLIQDNLRRQAASDVTVITIAHRLQSVMDADRIVSTQMVLDSGRVIEFDTPASLLKSDGGVFRSLVDESLKKAVSNQN